MAKTKQPKTTIKRISNPITGAHYRLRVRSTSAGKRGTIIGRWKPTNSLNESEVKND